jgi:hypothetical protein
MICFQEQGGSALSPSVIGVVTALESAANMCLESKVPQMASQTPLESPMRKFQIPSTKHQANPKHSNLKAQYESSVANRG